jgi:Flp pilus assembly pilin Flp
MKAALVKQRRNRGASAIEYAITIVLVAISSIAGLKMFGAEVRCRSSQAVAMFSGGSVSDSCDPSGGGGASSAQSTSAAADTGPTAGVVCVGSSCTVGSNKCFVAGTLVWTESGQVPIETIQPGTQVLSRAEEGGELEWKPVVRTFHRAVESIVNLAVRDPHGAEQRVELTAEHRLFARGRGWVEAAELEPGRDVLEDKEHNPLLLVGAESVPRETTVFNLEIAELHTYFVGAEAIWAHNDCNSQPASGGGSAAAGGGEPAPGGEAATASGPSTEERAGAVASIAYSVYGDKSDPSVQGAFDHLESLGGQVIQQDRKEGWNEGFQAVTVEFKNDNGAPLLAVGFRGTAANNDFYADFGVFNNLMTPGSASSVRNTLNGPAPPRRMAGSPSSSLADRLRLSREYYDETVAQNGDGHDVIVAGHSLGGLLASHVAYHNDVDGYTFNSAPGAKYTLIGSPGEYDDSRGSKIWNNRIDGDPVSGPSPLLDKDGFPYGHIGTISNWPPAQAGDNLLNRHRMGQFGGRFGTHGRKNGSAPTNGYFW